MGLGGTCRPYMGYFLPHSVHFFKVVCNWKTVGCSEEMIEIVLGVLEEHTVSFDLVFNYILESFGAHVSNWPLSQTRLSVSDGD